METLVGTEFSEQVMLDILCTICCSLFSSTYCAHHVGAHHEGSLIHLLSHAKSGGGHDFPLVRRQNWGNRGGLEGGTVALGLAVLRDREGKAAVASCSWPGEWWSAWPRRLEQAEG